MSFLTTAPEMVTAAAGNLAGLGSTLQEATAAASGSTTTLVAAGADDVSIAISRLFGTFGQEFQAMSAQAVAFHNEFVSLLSGGAAAYVSAEAINAQQMLLNAVSPASTMNTAASSLLGGLGGTLSGGTSGGILGGLAPVVGGGPLGPVLGVVGTGTGGVLSNIISGGLSSVLTNPVGTLLQPLLQPFLPQLFGSGGMAPSAPPPDPWLVLFAQTGANLQNLFANWATDPFPFLHQVALNQLGYGEEIAGGLAYSVLNFPAIVANAPMNIQMAIQPALNFNPIVAGQVFIDQQVGWATTFTTSLQKFNADLQTTLPVFRADMALANQAIAAGDYHGAVQDFTHGVLGLFVTGFDTSNLSDIKVLGPAADLLPILGIPAQQAQAFASLFPPNSIPGEMAHNYYNVVSTLTNTNVSATFSLNPTGAPLVVADAFFGLPLALGFSLLGAPVSGLNGLATGATMLNIAMQSGNPLAVGGALIDLPAYGLNGFLNGETIVDLALPVSTSTVLPSFLGPLGPIGPILEELLNITGIDPTIPIVAHLPFDGLLVPPQAVTATIDVTAAGVTIPINVTLGGTPFGGLIPALVNTVPRDLAAAITPK